MLCWSAFAIWMLPKCSQHSHQMEMKSTCELRSLRPLRGLPRTLICTTFMSKFQHLLNTPVPSQENLKESTTKPEKSLKKINLKIWESYLDDFLLSVLIPQLPYHTNNTESRNCRIIFLGKAFKITKFNHQSNLPKSCRSATSLSAASTQLTCLQGWGLHHCPGQPLAVLDHTFYGKKLFLRSNLKLSWSNLTLAHVHP